ncbi:MAG: putative lipid II flippase FtsW [Candidatus Spechtbacterales bacterium]|nr:putative lipid II flippase FtsW [Candidatus Spechtbacterales bacterium]
MPKNKKPDKILLIVVTLLIVVGMIILISASIEQSKEDFGNIYGYFLHQFIYGILLGGVLGASAYLFPYKKLQKLALPLLLGALFLLMLVFVPGVGIEIGGSQRWINLGFGTFQPSELLKLTFIIYLATWLASKVKNIKKNPHFIPFLILLGILSLLVLLQPDLSTFGIIAITAAAMYFVSGVGFRYIAAMGGLGLLAFYALVKVAPYRLNRVFTFLNPESDPLGMGYQINQLLIAVGSGRIWGVGPLNGEQKYFLPLAMNDSIYAVWAEETGFIGAFLLLSLFVALAWRGFIVAKSSKTKFGEFLAIGISVWFFTQMLVNVGSILGVFPLTGVTLPFISYGSSSMMVTMMAAGILLQISKEVN